jgi:hypothetical protein
MYLVDRCKQIVYINGYTDRHSIDFQHLQTLFFLSFFSHPSLLPKLAKITELLTLITVPWLSWILDLPSPVGCRGQILAAL